MEPSREAVDAARADRADDALPASGEGAEGTAGGSVFTRLRAPAAVVPEGHEEGADGAAPVSEEAPEAFMPARATGTTEYHALTPTLGSRSGEPQITPQAMETMSEMGAGASESPTELADRVGAIAQVLTDNGHTEREVATAMKVEYLRAQLADE